MKDTFIQNSKILRGSSTYPLLAPRGVWIANQKLFVSDTGQNRVFIWNNIPEDMHQAPDVVLGQINETNTSRNAGVSVSASTLQYPSGIWSDGQKLIVADAWNHRVLIWHQLPTKHGQAADVVLGQPHFESNEPNVAGISQPPSAQSLYWCYGVFSDGKHLWIADTGNRRVLFYEQIPTENYAPADAVIGQPDFNSRDYDPQNALWPYSVKVSKSGVLAITDTQYYRILLWNDWRTAPQQAANCLIGQKDFDSNGQNQFLPRPEAHTLSWCYDTCFYQEGIIIADTGNSRLLYFEEIPSSDGVPAQKVWGKPDFRTSSENVNTQLGTENTLYWSFAIAAEDDVLAIADTGNHRLLLHKL